MHRDLMPQSEPLHLPHSGLAGKLSELKMGTALFFLMNRLLHSPKAALGGSRCLVGQYSGQPTGETLFKCLIKKKMAAGILKTDLMKRLKCLTNMEWMPLLPSAVTGRC